jgi:hypothetical protein
MIERNYKFRYIRNNKGNPRGVIAVNTITGEIGWSFCCKTDRFVKSIARKIALDRMGKIIHTKTVPRDVEVEIIKAEEWLENRWRIARELYLQCRR